MDGAGYIEDSPEKNEKKTISCICSLFAVSLILSFVTGIAVQLLMIHVLKSNGSIIEWNLFSGFISCSEKDKMLIIIVSGVFSFLAPVIMLMSVLKLPLSIIVPKSNISKTTFIYTIPLMIVFFAMSFYCNSFSNNLFKLIGFNNPSPTLFVPEDTRLLPSAIVYYIIILPVITEFLFSGIILQSLRQFGDEFAIIVTSIFSAIFVHNFFDSGYTFILSIIISYIAIRTGSLFSAVFSRAIFVSTSLFIFSIQRILSPEDFKIILSWSLFSMILWGFLILKMLSNKHKSILNLRKHISYCSIGKKYVCVFSSIAVLSFCVVSFVIQLFMLEFTKLL